MKEWREESTWWYWYDIRLDDSLQFSSSPKVVNKAMPPKNKITPIDFTPIRIFIKPKLPPIPKEGIYPNHPSWSSFLVLNPALPIQRLVTGRKIHVNIEFCALLLQPEYDFVFHRWFARWSSSFRSIGEVRKLERKVVKSHSDGARALPRGAGQRQKVNWQRDKFTFSVSLYFFIKYY